MPEKIGDYKVVSTLGSGAFGDVYKAEKDGKIYAIKHITISSKENSVLLQREVDSHKSLPRHPNIVEFVDHFKSFFMWNIVMEYCDLGNLEAYVVANRPGKEIALSLMRDMANGLNHLHNNNIVHRDIKPENILLCKTRFGLPICKISDFGLARFGNLGQTNGSVEGDLYFQTLCGTPYFLAPEVRNRQYTRSCDIFSLGIVFYLLFFNEGNRIKKLVPWAEGGTPFYKATDMQIKRQLKVHIHDEKILNTVLSMLTTDFHKRITAAGLAEELNRSDTTDDEVFAAALIIFGLVLVFVFLPFPLFLLFVLLVGLACWEFEFIPKSAWRDVSLFS